MGSFSKNASRTALPLSLALTIFACVAESTEEPHPGGVAEADTSAPSGTAPQCSADGGAYAPAGYLGLNPYLYGPGYLAGEGYLGYGTGYLGGPSYLGAYGPGYPGSYGPGYPGSYGPGYPGSYGLGYPGYGPAYLGGYGSAYPGGYGSSYLGGYYGSPYAGWPLYAPPQAPPLPDGGC